MPSIKAIYQMEQEFHPYLQVEFIPNNTQREGIILQTKRGNIRRYYTFQNPNDIKELRKLIWDNLVIDYKIRDVYNKDNFTIDYRKIGKFKVLDSYQKAKQAKALNCVKHYPIKDYYKEKPTKGIKRQEYNVDSTYNITNCEQCKKIRMMQCDHNFPTKSHSNAICKLETEYYCNKRYPKNLKKAPSKKIVVSTYPHVPKHPNYFQYVVNLLNYVVYILVSP
tara:strand:- start:26059 stop:26724 length:666 start_codon:yes stop_codon:yes gene_type:complete